MSGLCHHHIESSDDHQLCTVTVHIIIMVGSDYLQVYMVTAIVIVSRLR
jgi:hypothetical protein